MKNNIYYHSRGLDAFLEYKKLDYNEAVNAFLLHEGIEKFNAKNYKKSIAYIENNWNKFATFVDKALKNNLISGERIKLNSYYDEQKEFKNNCINEYNEATKEEQVLFHLIKKYDDILHLSKTMSFFNKKGIKLPKSQDGLSRFKKILPKIDFILDSEYKEEYINFLKQ